MNLHPGVSSWGFFEKQKAELPLTIQSKLGLLALVFEVIPD